MCAAHTGKWGAFPSVEADSAGRLPSPSFCELREQYIRLEERRQFPRLPLRLKVSIRRVGGRIEPAPVPAATADISCGGLRFLTDRKLAPGTSLDLEILMADQPMGGPSLRMFTHAHVIRQSPTGRPGWTGVAAVFDDILFDRDPTPDHHSH